MTPNALKVFALALQNSDQLPIEELIELYDGVVTLAASEPDSEAYQQASHILCCLRNAHEKQTTFFRQLRA